MSEKYYTVDEISELLKIHPKTVQRYIREGKLKAAKVGKSWRVSGHDLSTFAEGADAIGQTPSVFQEQAAPADIKVSAVIDIPVAGTQESIRIANTLTAISNSKPSGYGASSLQTQYLMTENVMRVMIWGNLDFTQIIMDSIASLLETQERY